MQLYTVHYGCPPTKDDHAISVVIAESKEDAVSIVNGGVPAAEGWQLVEDNPRYAKADEGIMGYCTVSDGIPLQRGYAISIYPIPWGRDKEGV